MRCGEAHCIFDKGDAVYDFVDFNKVLEICEIGSIEGLGEELIDIDLFCEHNGA